MRDTWNVWFPITALLAISVAALSLPWLVAGPLRRDNALLRKFLPGVLFLFAWLATYILAGVFDRQAVVDGEAHPALLHRVE